MNAVAEALPLWAWLALLGGCLFVVGIALLLGAGARQFDEAIAQELDEYDEPIDYWPAGADYWSDEWATDTEQAIAQAVEIPNGPFSNAADLCRRVVDELAARREHHHTN